MVSWILSQQLSLTLTLLLLIASAQFASDRFGARLTYSLWWLVPLVLLANQLPSDLVTVVDSPTYRYVVNYENQSATMGSQFSWQFLWWVGALSVFMAAAYQQWKLEQVQGRPVSQSLKSKLPASLRAELSGAVDSPVLAGLIRPRLLLPRDFETSYSRSDQELILRHELVHWRRKDALANGLALAALMLFWFNPVAWWAYAVFRLNQEQACDAAVLQGANKQTKIRYSKALVACAELTSRSLSISPHYGDKNSMIKRITSIQKGVTTQVKWALAALALATTVISGVVMAKQKSYADTANLAKPLTRVEPIYPIQAADQGLEGSVVLTFDIAADGSTDNVKVQQANPDNVFNRSAVEAVRQWTYKPRVVGGKAEPQHGLVVQLDFVLSETHHEKITVARDKS